jgi:hypothetical protein
VLSDIKVLRVVELRVERVLDALDDSRLQIDQERPRDIVFIVGLVKEDILPVVALSGVFLEHAFRVDSVLHAELLPELHSDLVAALAHLQGDDLSRHFCATLI